MKYFGTDGIREKADKFTPEFLTKIVAGLVDYAGTDIKVFLAGDTSRLLCPWGFSRQEYWSGLPCILPGDPPNLGVKSRSPASRFLTV